MPGSSTFGKIHLLGTLIRFSQRQPLSRIVDIGPGLGTYVDMLRPFLANSHFTAIEAWGPYVKEYSLEQKYERIIVGDARYIDYSKIGPFDCAILGDMLEHMPLSDAVALVDNLLNVTRIVAASIPIGHTSQGEEYGNPFEVHVEQDYTLEIIWEQFPNVVELFKDGYMGVAFFSRKKADRDLLCECFSWTAAKATAIYEKFGQVRDFDYTDLAARLRTLLEASEPV